MEGRLLYMFFMYSCNDMDGMGWIDGWDGMGWDGWDWEIRI